MIFLIFLIGCDLLIWPKIVLIKTRYFLIHGESPRRSPAWVECWSRELAEKRNLWWYFLMCQQARSIVWTMIFLIGCDLLTWPKIVLIKTRYFMIHGKPPRKSPAWAECWSRELAEKLITASGALRHNDSRRCLHRLSSPVFVWGRIWSIEIGKIEIRAGLAWIFTTRTLTWARETTVFEDQVYDEHRQCNSGPDFHSEQGFFPRDTVMRKDAYCSVAHRTQGQTCDEPEYSFPFWIKDFLCWLMCANALRLQLETGGK